MAGRLVACVAFWAILTSAVWQSPACAVTIVSGDENPDIVEAFQKHILSKSVSESVQTSLEKMFAGDIADPAALVTEVLAAVYPDYQSAVASSDDDELDSAVAVLGKFVDSDDRYLAADASFYLARTLMNHERYEDAMPHLQRLQSDLSEFTAQPAAIQYFLGVAHAGMLNNDAAMAALMKFLQEYPDAPERLRVSAWRQAQDLQGISEGQLSDVHQRMDYSRRRLEIEELGKETQTEQDQIVKMLTKLIKEQEKKECSSCNSKSQSQSQQQQQQDQAQNKPNPSKSDQGGTSNNPNGKFVEKAYDIGDASPWSRLREMGRDPANSAIKEKLPPHLRDVIQRYNDAVNGIDKK
jgi:tetratricopeptide (TPR) repeat protein